MATKISNLEKAVDILITPAVLILGVLIIGEIFFGFEKYEPWITIADLVVIGVFVLDLILKWRRVHDVKTFVKLYWLEILAVFPFYLIFRGFGFLQNILPFGESSEIVQRTLHETSLLRESRELEVLSKEERLAARGLRFGQRVLRLVALKLRHAYRRLRHAHHKIRNN